MREVKAAAQSVTRLSHLSAQDDSGTDALDRLVPQIATDNLKREEHRGARALARDEAIIDHDGLVRKEQGPVLGEDVLEAGVGGGAPAGEQPELGKDGRRGTDRRERKATARVLDQGVAERRAGAQVGRPGNAAGN